jgi:hypothetical protein
MPFVSFIANTVNGQILEFPQKFELNCATVTPIGVDVVRQYDGNECINATKVFLFYSRGQVLGTKQFENTNDFINYVNSECKDKAINCKVTINSCFTTINGCYFTINNK